jgi:uncharacterized membrane protein
MTQQAQQVWMILLKAGVVQGTVPEDTGKLESPWYVSVLLAFSGWIAALFLLGFLGLGFESIFRNSTATFIIGAMMISGAFAILRIPKNEFVEHLALAASLAGQALVIFSIYKITDHNQGLFWMLVTLLQMLLAAIIPSFIHRVFSSFVAAYAFSMAMTFIGLPYLVIGMVMLLAALCWLNEFRYPQYMRTIRAIGYGLVLALIQLKGTALFGYRTMGWLYSHHQTELLVSPWIGELLVAAVTLFVVWNILQRYNQAMFAPVPIMALLGTLLLCAASTQIQGITVGMVIMLLGFVGVNRTLLSLGIASLLFFISCYYYFLNTTLLDKSLTLLTVGLVLLAVRWLMLHILLVKKEVKHA